MFFMNKYFQKIDGDDTDCIENISSKKLKPPPQNFDEQTNMLAKDTTLEMKILSDKKSGFGLNEEIVGLAFASIPIDTSFETNSFEESSTKSSKLI